MAAKRVLQLGWNAIFACSFSTGHVTALLLELKCLLLCQAGLSPGARSANVHHCRG